MGARVLLCLDEITCANPGLIGLDGENLSIQEWLEICHDGRSARNGAAEAEGVEEAWVVSCDDVAPINLAATLKSDNPDLNVRLVDFEAGGSVKSRAHTASIDEVLGKSAFLERYNLEKRRAAGQAAVSGADSASAHAGGPRANASGEAGGADVPPSPEPQNGKEGMSCELPEAAVEVASRTAPRASAPPETASTPEPEPRLLAGGLVGKPRIAVKSEAFVLPVVSGSGGAGKSTVAVLAAHLCSEMGYRTLLLDYDLQFGDMAALCGIENPLTVEEALAHPDKLSQEALREGGPALVAAPERLETAESIARGVPALLDAASQLFDVIVANTGASWAEQHAALLERASAALFLVDQRSSSVRACRHALGLCARCGIATGQFKFVLNRCAKGAPLSAMDVSCALQGAPVSELKDGGRDVEDYLAAGAVADLLKSGNDLCMSLERLLADVLPASAQAKADQGQDRGFAAGKRRGRHVGKRKGWGR